MAAQSSVALGFGLGHITDAARLVQTRQARHGCGCSSGVEHDLAKVGVEGSNPFARSNYFIQIMPLRDAFGASFSRARLWRAR